MYDVTARLLAVVFTTALLYSLFGGPYPYWTLTAALATGLGALGWLEHRGDL